MVVKCDTREEAEELQSDCLICKHPKFVIEAHYEAQGTHFTIDRCNDPSCTVHCHGHEGRAVRIDLGDDENSASVIGVG